MLGQSPKIEALGLSDQRISHMEIDRTSQRIIAILQRDGRCPNTVIAREVGISESAVRARIQGLISSGVLQIIGLTDPGNMGFGVMAYRTGSLVGPITMHALFNATTMIVTYLDHLQRLARQ